MTAKSEKSAKVATPDPETVEIPSPPRTLDPVAKRRRMVAKYLHILGELVEKGDIRAFDIAWNITVGDQPVGNLMMDSTSMKVAPEAEPIEVEDLSEKLKTDESESGKGCGNPDCENCSTRS